METKFRENQYVIYTNGEDVQIGKIKRLTDTGAFVWYHSGDTAAKTPYESITPITNAYCIIDTLLGKGELK